MAAAVEEASAAADAPAAAKAAAAATTAPLPSGDRLDVSSLGDSQGGKGKGAAAELLER